MGEPTEGGYHHFFYTSLKQYKEELMNHKQKFLYTLLGAGIMAVGITIGQFITSDIEAQSHGVFDKIICRELEVVDKDGKKAIVLRSNEDYNKVIVYNPQSKRANVVGVRLVAFDNGNNAVQVCDKQGGVGVVLSSTNIGNAMSITRSQEKSAIMLVSNEQHNSMFLYDLQREDKQAIRLQSTEGINAVTLFDEQEDTAVTLHSGKGTNSKELGNGIFVIDKTRKITTLGD